MYTQCSLRKNIPDGFRQYVAWIPSRFAVCNTVIKVKNDSVWEDGWIVTGCGATCKDSDLIEKHWILKGHRKHSDI